MVFKIKRGVIIIICLAVFLAVVGIGEVIRDYTSKINSLKSYNEMKDDSISYYRNEQDQLVAQRDAALVRVKDFREMENSLLRKMASEFKGVDKKLKNLASATSANSVVKQNFTTQIKDSVIVSKINETTYDTLMVKAIDYQDQWSRIRGYALQDCVKVDVEVSVPLQIVTYYPRWRLFGKERRWLPVKRKSVKIEAKSPNPNVTITEIEHVQTKK
jgi:hypothetical protein